MFLRLLSPLALFVCLGVAAKAAAAPPPGGSYDDLAAFFRQWRSFQKPKIVDGVPDYGAAAMAAQAKELEAYRARLKAIDPSGWPIPQQVDYYVVRAELAGLDFDHRVLKPWAHNPAFYVTVFDEESDQPAREGPFALGAVELWSYKFPLSPADAAKIDAGIKTIPGLLAQAKTNLTGNQKDIWNYGTQSVKQQSGILGKLAGQLGTGDTALKADVEKAKAATDDFAKWLEAQCPSKSGPAGVGIENYDWYLKNVQLVPYTGAEEVARMERELARSRALLAMEELKNAKLPPQNVEITNAEQYDKAFNTG